MRTHKCYTFEEWLVRCKEIHGNNYNYDCTDFNQKDEKGRVKIFCNILNDDGEPYGYFWQLPYDHMIGKNYCESSSLRKHTTKWFKKQVELVYGDLYDTSKSIYKTKRDKLIVTCHKKDEFGEEYGDLEVYPLEFLKGKTFPDDPKRKYNTNYIIKKIKQLYGDKYDCNLVEYHGFRKPIKLKCNKCGEILEVRIKSILGGNYKCTNCSINIESSLEFMMKEKLELNKIEYKQYYNFNWLKNKQPLSLDFYLPQYNIAIECQGRFHFEPYQSNVNDLEKQRQRDILKYQLCKEHGVKIIYLTENQFKKYQNNYFSQLYFSTDEIIKNIK